MTGCRLEPTLYRVVIQTSGPSEKTEGGIYIPRDLSEREEQGQTDGVIVSIGPTAFPKGGPKVGQRVLFARYAGQVWVEDSTEEWYRIVNDEDIVAVIGDKE